MAGAEAVNGRVIAGIGLRRDCPADEIVALVRRAAASIGREVTALAAPSFKQRERGLHGAASTLGVRLLLVSEAALAAVQGDCVTRSALSLRAVGVASVADGSALAAAGRGGKLLLPRMASGRATCALAEISA